ncbi:YHS domain-containing (seleno)protein [Falsiroseomonas oryziterrae]|uniref:YHS domain-containing (seleno)protein n=1 Tax=Falsiroseomonas oryziterrae TaxID=2911368 RepID=UPI001F2580BD|nr:YHS domain-containing (seleno)protein [Roseomonas sp. NPKOSM-4]
MIPAFRPGRRALSGLLICLAIAPEVRAQAAKPAVLTEAGLALRGFDPVAYFAAGAPVRGEQRFEVEWGGARWRFASAANRDRFLADPARHAPAYGGYCAWAVAQGYTAPGDPRHWRIEGGRLYLNFDAAVHRRWLRDIPGFIAAADRNWPGVLSR